MKKVVLIALVLMAIIALFYFVNRQSSVLQTYYITNCQEINQSGNYVLANDILSSSTCIKIKSDNVNIDGNNHLITGSKKAIEYAIESTDHKKITITNISVKEYGAGINLANVNDAQLTNMNLSSNLYAISITNSSNIKISNNSLLANFFGIYFVNVSDSSISQNKILNSGNRAIGIVMSTHNTFQDNFLTRNLIPFDEIGDGDNTYESNTFFKNINSLFSVSRESSLIEQNKKTSLLIQLPYNSLETCKGCSYALELLPNESSFTYSVRKNTLNVSFIPTRKGLYSIVMHVTDTNKNNDFRKITYLVGPTANDTETYYLRGVDPVHGQSISWGNDNADSGSLLLNHPHINEIRSCSDWIQFSPDELPTYMFGFVRKIDSSIYYSQNSSNASIGIERIATYDRNVENSIPINSSSSINLANVSFNVDWPIDYSWEWYWITLKLSTQTGWPKIYLDSSHPSIASITYNYPSTPAIFSQETKITTLLSATTSEDGKALLQFEGDEVAEISLQMNDPVDHYKAFFNGINCDESSSCLMKDLGNGKISFAVELKGRGEIEIVPDKIYKSI